MHLGRSTKKVKGKTYIYYSLVESFRNENGQPRKKIIKPLGRLNDEELERWKLKLAIINNELSIDDMVQLEDLSFIDAKRYLDVALISHMYDQIGINKAFYRREKKQEKISLQSVVKILITARCLDPICKYKTVNFLNDSYLGELMQIENQAYEKNKIYRELPAIEERKERLQSIFLNFSRALTSQNSAENELFFFDGTTSFFEGNSCELGTHGIDKTHGEQDHIILICLLTDRQGFPIAWDTFSGEKRDVTEFKKIAKDLAKTAKIKNVTFCFDRGIASESNFNLIDKVFDSKYITGLRSNQINPIFDLKQFEKHTRQKLVQKVLNETLKESNKRIKPIDGFYRLSNNRFFQDLGVIRSGGKKNRYIVSFNAEIFKKEQQNRDRKINFAQAELEKLSNELQSARKDRDCDAIERKISKILKKYRLATMIETTLCPKSIPHNGRDIQTYKLTYSLKEDVYREASFTDGILVYITNHTETDDRGNFIVSASTIVQYYKNKYVIEDSFRNLKSILDLRPFFVYKDDHVKAHVDICMAAYFINHRIRLALNEIEMSLPTFYELLKKHARTCTVEAQGRNITLLRQLPKELLEALRVLDANKIINKGVLKQIGITKK